MQRVELPRTGVLKAWRDAARAALVAGTPPEALRWTRAGEGAAADLFDGGAPGPLPGASATATATPRPAPTAPRAFTQLDRAVVFHSDPQRFARLYAMLWALQDRPALLRDRAAPAVAQLYAMEKSVRRDLHKMHAFLRFREVTPEGAPRRSFAAWFEPEHPILEAAVPFFARRFGDMDWAIFTPDLSAFFEGGAVRFEAGRPRPPLPEDATEDLWRTYFANIFNPARLKVKAMQSEMPQKYWKNLPEAQLIPGLIAGAQARAARMAAAAPSVPPERAGKITQRLSQDLAARRPAAPAGRPASLEALNAQLGACTRCALHCHATQAVPGEGPAKAPLMVVGEQPGDQEDLSGRPFTGPAGQLFDRLAGRARLPRRAAYVTNAVKHFKFQPRGKRRIHQSPDRGEVEACRWWLDAERALVKPKLVLALGATAAGALTGSGQGVLAREGRLERAADGTPVLIARHPSAVLRARGAQAQAEAEAALQRVLAQAAGYMERPETLTAALAAALAEVPAPRA